MTTQRQSKRRARTSLTLWLILLTVGLGAFSAGSAPAQVTAREDSLSQAFFLLKYDYDVLLAKSTAESRVDSLRISLVNEAWESRLEAERELRTKILWTVIVSSLAAGGLIYLGTLAQ